MDLRFGYIAYGTDELYHFGAIFSAIRLQKYVPSAKIIILTDRPALYSKYDFEVLSLSESDKNEMSFGGRYHFGIKSKGLIELLKRCDKLFYLDTDMYPVGDLSGVFDRITPQLSIMRMNEGRAGAEYLELSGKGVTVGDQVLRGDEDMWNSGILGVDHSNMFLLERAYHATEKVSRILKTHTPEQFCIGVALQQEGRKINPHRSAIRNYSTSGKKKFARSQISSFFSENGNSDVMRQIEASLEVRLWRTPIDLFRQKILRT